MERAAKSELAVHPWTERPELSYFSDPPPGTPPFESALDEIQHMFCTVGVHGEHKKTVPCCIVLSKNLFTVYFTSLSTGIFSESVDVAVLASTLPCPDATNPVHPPSKTSESPGNCDQVCHQVDSKFHVYVGFSSFTLGLLVAAGCSCLCTRGNFLRRNQQQVQVPTEDVDITNDDLELTNDDMEML
jgi:hypothetical protein